MRPAWSGSAASSSALGIFLLVTVSFLLYGIKTESLVKKQTTQAARMLVNPTLMNIHYKKLGNEKFESIIDVLWGGLRPLDDLPNSEAWVLNPYSTKDPKKQPADDFERATLARFLQAATDEDAMRKTGKPREKPYYFADGTPDVGRPDQQGQERVPVHSGSDIQVELPDGLPQQGQQRT